MIKVSDEILNLKPYVPGKSIAEVQREYGLKEIYKLASNENPLGPSRKVIEAIKKSLVDIHRYPDGSYFELKNAIANNYSIDSKYVTCGNGSNELIDLLVRIFCEPGSSILITEGTFVAYKVCAHANRVKVTSVPLKKDLSTPCKELLKAWTPEHKIIFLPNPNNPTGCYINMADLDLIMKELGNSEQVMIVLDEAYVEYVRAKDYPNGIDYFKKYKNVVLLRTMAKAYGLAGLRLGALISQPEVVELIDRVRNPFNVNLLVAEAAKVAFQDREYLQESQKIVWDGLDYFYDEFNEMGIDYCPSQGNFIFFDTKKDSTKIFEALLKRGVILRPLKNYGFMTQLRMSVGLQNENEKAMACLKELI